MKTETKQISSHKIQLDVIHVSDNVAGCKRLPDDCIDLVVTSPPYDNLREYGGHSWNFEYLADELVRTLKPGGVIVWIVADGVEKGSETGSSFRQALGFMDRGLALHDTMIWEKGNFSHPAHGRYHQIFEYMFVFSKGRPSTFNPIKDKKNTWCKPMGRNTMRAKDGSRSERPVYAINEYGMRTNVWRKMTTGQEKPCKKVVEQDHPAVFPESLAGDHILSWSNPGDLVVDPFMGSGTTAVAAREHGRHYIGFEVNDAYRPIWQSRLAQNLLNL